MRLLGAQDDTVLNVVNNVKVDERVKSVTVSITPDGYILVDDGTNKRIFEKQENFEDFMKFWVRHWRGCQKFWARNKREVV